MTDDERRAILEMNDLVFARWPNPNAKDGVDTTVIKGISLLRESVLANKTVNVVMQTIDCDSFEHAQDVRQRLGGDLADN